MKLFKYGMSNVKMSETKLLNLKCFHFRLEGYEDEHEENLVLILWCNDTHWVK